ncbi:MAG: YggS family pyridoxal phosphate-dependent enzyme [Dictyoglomus sp.]|nr:YggS family pyridoxal phosphate-dependent enzyme [Dictyoglomus sp.]MCX7942350.1 YggS family pyridoxal phosphate-dependent enzyme [Dictyoglomaceae bacterium]MDW8188446.1 YggS family pyridoxal phosphate-dependent enzyme [Dictyoglomus sp.]
MIDDLNYIRENWEKVRENIERIACRVGRRVEEIKVVAVAKGVSSSHVKEAFFSGIKMIGENRVQEAEKKIMELSDLPIEWHMVGHLQINKVKKAVKLFSLIHSLDRFSLAYELNKEGEKLGKKIQVLIQFNTSGEPSKFGFREEDFYKNLDSIMNLKNIEILGLMTIGPLTSDKNLIRISFRKLYEIREKLKIETGLKLPYLSMGMSDDYSIAIEEGANLLRLGRIIFLKDFEVIL